METILATVSEMRNKLKSIYSKDYRFSFDITATERRKLTDLFEQKLEEFQSLPRWSEEEFLSKEILSSFEKMKIETIIPNDYLYFRSCVNLTNDLKNFQNRTQHAPKLLFATGVMDLTKVVKDHIHHYDFLDKEVLYALALSEMISSSHPKVVVVSEILDYFESPDKAKEMLTICLCFPDIHFVLFGDLFGKNEELIKLTNVSFLPSNIRHFEELLTQTFEVIK